MKSIAIPLAGAALAALLAVGVTAAANPTAPATATPAPVATPAATSPIAAILGLTDAQVMELRHAGKSLAQIAEQQKVDPQRLIDALVTQWSSRIDARVAAGALTADQAATLKANLDTQAKAMVNQVTMGGMMGGAVGAGPNGTHGMGTGGMGGRGGMMNGQGGMHGQGGTMNGAGRGMMNGSGTCPMASATPAS